MVSAIQGSFIAPIYLSASWRPDTAYRRGSRFAQLCELQVLMASSSLWPLLVARRSFCAAYPSVVDHSQAHVLR